jgi:hypothetical protein
MRNLITEPQDAYPDYEPSEDDWMEFYEYVEQCEAQEEAEAFEEANLELAAIDSPL